MTGFLLDPDTVGLDPTGARGAPGDSVTPSSMYGRHRSRSRSGLGGEAPWLAALIGRGKQDGEVSCVVRPPALHREAGRLELHGHLRDQLFVVDRFNKSQRRLARTRERRDELVFVGAFRALPKALS